MDKTKTKVKEISYELYEKGDLLRKEQKKLNNAMENANEKVININRAHKKTATY